jgi:hypothetical protein
MWAVMLGFAVVLGFSGCDVLKSMGFTNDDGESGTEGEKPVTQGDPPYAYAATGKLVFGAKNEPNIKVKFEKAKDITGRDGVEAAFLELHKFIENGYFAQDLGQPEQSRVIQLGNYIELEDGLVVDPSEKLEDDGDDWVDENLRGKISLGSESKEKLRLIVVGINSFRSGSVAGYSEPKNDGVDHVVFQFENVPGTHRMNPLNYNAGGYEVSEMRKYLKKNFLDGLEAAGVPIEVLWAPTRSVSKPHIPALVSEISNDLLWLPTAWEMFKEGKNFTTGSVKADASETRENQTWLEYYKNGCKKSNMTGDAQAYWTASISTTTDEFCRVNTSTYSATVSMSASTVSGAVPAFCVGVKRP